jgi:hypothetical protein
MMTEIIVKLEIAGLHHWPTCDIKEVDYLKNVHRHVFHITCYKEVNHDDRETEFIKLKQEITRDINDWFFEPEKGICHFRNLSCEMIAKKLIETYRLTECTVLEDNENGARVRV